VHVGAILTVPRETHLDRESDEECDSRGEKSRPIACLEVLGESLLDRILVRLRASGVNESTVIFEPAQGPVQDLDGCSDFWKQWEDAVGKYLNYQLRTLLLFRIGPYVELDVPDFVQFHRGAGNPMTQAVDLHGPLDLVAIDGEELQNGSGSFRGRLRAILPRQQKYKFSGYSNRLRTLQDFRRLVKDSLQGQAAIRPHGREIRSDVWLGEGAVIHESSQVHGPAFIGRNTQIKADCVISGYSVIERDCTVDCGTSISDSCVLAGTYVGMGLKVANSIVAGASLFHLGRNLQMRVDDPRIIGDEKQGWSFAEYLRRGDS
jgi:NDP-sugar pyrophosphorylase family protein